MKKAIVTTIILLLCGVDYPLNAQSTIWSTTVEGKVDNFSSPHTADLNGDGILDIVTGGGLEGFTREQSVNAFDGFTGEIMWQVKARDQIFGSAVFKDITEDGYPDVFIGGRGAELMAINGNNGDVIWEFYEAGDSLDPVEKGYLQFYNLQFIPDESGDNIEDILVTNGGYPYAGPTDTVRPPGHLMIIDAVNGALLASAVMPDNKESYMSTLVYDFEGDGILDIIFGTGGETIGGHLYRATVADVVDEDLSGAIELLADDEKGFIAPPSLADVDEDGILDIIIAGYGDKTAAISGSTNKKIWEVVWPETETIASPAIGRFNEDYVPDVFTILGQGIAPVFLEYYAIMIDGTNGQIAYIDTLPGWSLVSPVAVDMNGDFYDEVIVVNNKNFAEGAPFESQMLVYNFNKNEIKKDLIDWEEGTNLGSTPWVGDLDFDNKLDLVYSRHAGSSVPMPGEGFIITRLEFNNFVPANIAWGSYMGTNYDCVYYNPLAECDDFMVTFTTEEITCYDAGDGILKAKVESGTSPYRFSIDGGLFSPPSSANASVTVPKLTPGMHSLEIIDANGCSDKYEYEFTDPDSIWLNLNVIDESVPGAKDGSINVLASGGAGDFTYQWDTDPNNNSNTLGGLSSGVYELTVIDKDGCSITESIMLGLTDINDKTAEAFPFHIYPNPANEILFIDGLTDFMGRDINLSLYNLHGQKVLTKTFLNNTEKNILVSHLQAGTYLLKVEMKEGESHWQKVILF